jgi:hypothetical protein
MRTEPHPLFLLRVHCAPGRSMDLIAAYTDAKVETEMRHLVDVQYRRRVLPVWLTRPGEAIVCSIRGPHPAGYVIDTVILLVCRCLLSDILPPVQQLARSAEEARYELPDRSEAGNREPRRPIRLTIRRQSERWAATIGCEPAEAVWSNRRRRAACRDHPRATRRHLLVECPPRPLSGPPRADWSLAVSSPRTPSD